MTIVLLALLTTAPPRVTLVGFQSSGVDEKKVRVISEFFGQQLGEKANVPITLPSDVAGIIGIERQKELLGCSDESSNCLAELAGALGADYLVSGSIAEIGGSWACSAKILRVKDNRTIGSTSRTLATEKEVLPFFGQSAEELAPRLKAALRGEDVVGVREVETGGGHPYRRYAWIPAAGGGVMLGAAGALQLMANNEYEKMVSGDAPPSPDAGNTGKTLQSAALGLTIAGAAALVTAGVLLFIPGDETVAIAPTEGGATVAIGGRF